MNPIDVEDPWGDDSGANKIGQEQQSVEAPFGEPHTLTSDDVAFVDEHQQDSATPAKKGGGSPNYAILAIAGLIGVATLAGVGLFFKSKLFPAAQPAPGPVLVQAPATMVDEGEPTSRSGANVFDVQGKPGEGGVLIGGEAASPAQQAASAIAPDSLATSSSETVSALNKTQSPSQVQVSAAPVQQVAATSTVPATAVACEPQVKTPHRNATSSRAKPKSKPDSARVASHRGNKASTTVSHVKKAKSSPGEEALADVVSGMRVHAIYPLSGPDVQAWLRDPGGRYTIVREGDFLANGVKVTRINAEKGEVLTSGGAIPAGASH